MTLLPTQYSKLYYVCIFRLTQFKMGLNKKGSVDKYFEKDPFLAPIPLTNNNISNGPSLVQSCCEEKQKIKCSGKNQKYFIIKNHKNNCFYFRNIATNNIKFTVLTSNSVFSINIIVSRNLSDSAGIHMFHCLTSD